MKKISYVVTYKQEYEGKLYKNAYYDCVSEGINIYNVTHSRRRPYILGVYLFNTEKQAKECCSKWIQSFKRDGTYNEDYNSWDKIDIYA